MLLLLLADVCGLLLAPKNMDRSKIKIETHVIVAAGAGFLG